MSTTPYVPSDEYDLDEDTLERVLELTDGENPVRFIDMDGPDTAEAIIRGIDSPERLAGWRLANQSFFEPPKEPVTDALDARDAALTAEPVETVPDTTPSVAATDGGTDTAEPAPDPTPESDPDALHPDVQGLDAGEVLVVDRDGATEYVWPTTPDAETPYLLRTFDAEGNERTTEPIALSKDEIFTRLEYDSDRRDADTIDVRAPATAANGGDA